MHHGTYDVGVMVVFLFQMVFMDTALTIVTGTAAERWKYAAFMVSSFVLGAFTIRCSRTGRGAAAGWRRSAPTSAWATATRTSPGPASCTRSAASRRSRWAS